MESVRGGGADKKKKKKKKKKKNLLGVTPLPLDPSPENPCRTWDPRAKFRILIKTRQSPRLHRSRPRPRPN